jgi:hypothetical protein
MVLETCRRSLNDAQIAFFQLLNQDTPNFKGKSLCFVYREMKMSLFNKNKLAGGAPSITDISPTNVPGDNSTNKTP